MYHQDDQSSSETLRGGDISGGFGNGDFISATVDEFGRTHPSPPLKKIKVEEDQEPFDVHVPPLPGILKHGAHTQGVVKQECIDNRSKPQSTGNATIFGHNAPHQVQPRYVAQWAGKEPIICAECKIPNASCAFTQTQLRKDNPKCIACVKSALGELKQKHQKKSPAKLKGCTMGCSLCGVIKQKGNFDKVNQKLGATAKCGKCVSELKKRKRVQEKRKVQPANVKLQIKESPQLNLNSMRCSMCGFIKSTYCFDSALRGAGDLACKTCVPKRRKMKAAADERPKPTEGVKVVGAFKPQPSAKGVLVSDVQDYVPAVSVNPKRKVATLAFANRHGIGEVATVNVPRGMGRGAHVNTPAWMAKQEQGSGPTGVPSNCTVPSNPGSDRGRMADYPGTPMGSSMAAQSSITSAERGRGADTHHVNNDGEPKSTPPVARKTNQRVRRKTTTTESELDDGTLITETECTEIHPDGTTITTLKRESTIEKTIDGSRYIERTVTTTKTEKMLEPVAS